jgi:hypothetical protein
MKSSVSSALGNIRILGPDTSAFNAFVKLVHDYIVELETQRNDLKTIVRNMDRIPGTGQVGC